MAVLQHCFPWFQLARISALPTAVSNVMLGYLLSVELNEGDPCYLELGLLVLASASMYSAGMILNDVFDLDRDRIERPERPLPSGRIRPARAYGVGIVLLILGIIVAAVAGAWHGARLDGVLGSVTMLRPLAIAGLLAITILAYDQWLKRTIVAPGLMGACRFLNVLLGGSLLFGSAETWIRLVSFAVPLLAIAAAMGVYVAGITVFGRREAAIDQSKSSLWLGVVLMLWGVAGLTFVDWAFSLASPRQRQLASLFPWLMVMLAFPVMRRAVGAAMNGKPAAIQAAIITGLRSIILFDAALCFLIAPDRPTYAISVVSLIIPSLVLSRWLRPT